MPDHYFGNLTNVPKKKIKTHKSLTLSGPPIREISSTMDSVSTPKKPTLFVYGKEDFKNNKKQYCPPKPDKDTNIFKVISYSYCQNGFERLF